MGRTERSHVLRATHRPVMSPFGPALDRAVEIEVRVLTEEFDERAGVLLPVDHGAQPVSYTHLTLPTIYSV